MNSARYRSLMQYILPLMIISSLISQTLVDFFLIICGGHWLYYFAKERNRKEFLPYTGLEWAFLGLFVAMLLSILVNYWGRWEFLWPIHKIKWVFEFYAMLWFMRRYGFDAEKTVKTILWVGLIPSIYAIATYINGTDYLNDGRPTSQRIVGLVNSATYHAHAGAILLAIACFYFFQLSSHKMKKAAYLAVPFGLFLIGFYLTYTRGAWIALIAGVAVYLALQSKKWLLIFLFTLATSISIAYQWGDTFKSRVQQTVDPAQIDSGRVGLFKAYFDVFQEHWLFGAGYDAYKSDGSIIPYTKRHGVTEDLQDSHAHNQYLQIAATSGVVGAVSFVSIFLISMLNGFSNFIFSKERSFLESKASFSVLSVVMVLMLSDQSFEYAKIRVVIVFALALRILEAQNKKRIKEGV